MIKFTKMHGLGNDYVYIDAINQKIENESSLAKFVSNRHFGIGSDGLILICKSEIADFKMRMFNSDGSEAEMCGNGIRCVGKFVYDKGLTNKTTVKIETLAGIKTLILNTKDGKVGTARVDMGEPILEAEKIPVISTEKPVKNLELEADEETTNELILKELEKQYRKYSKKYEGYDLKQRLTQALARKGYDYSDITSAIREYLDS